MYKITTLSFAMLLTLGVAASADAKKPKTAAATTEAAAAPAPRPLEIRTTGVADVDSVFNAAVAPVQTIQSARSAMDNLRKNLVTALGLTEGTPVKDALAELKAKGEGKLKLALSEQQVPQLSVSEAVPANVQAAVDALNSGANELSGLLPKVRELPPQFEQIHGAVQGISMDTLTNSGVSATEAPKVMKTVKGNLATLGQAKDEASALIQSADSLRDALRTHFGEGA